MRHLAVALLLIQLVGCGARTDLDPTGTRNDASPDGDGDVDSDVDVDGDGDADVEPHLCDVPTAEQCNVSIYADTWHFDVMVGEPTVVQEVEVLDDGTVLVAGYFGLWRMPPGGLFEPVEGVPEVLSSSFISMGHRGDREVFAVAFGELAVSDDGGLSWTVFELEGNSDSQILLIPEFAPMIIIGGDNRLTMVDPIAGVLELNYVPELDGDYGGRSENNTVFGLVRTDDGWLVAAERFGRVARAPALIGPWEELPDSRLYDPELVMLPDVGIVARVSGGDMLLSCDNGERWELLGNSGRFPSSAVHSTQLVGDGRSSFIAPGSDYIGYSCDLGQSWIQYQVDEDFTAYDAAIGPDGTYWIAEHNRVSRLWINFD